MRTKLATIPRRGLIDVGSPEVRKDIYELLLLRGSYFSGWSLSRENVLLLQKALHIPSVDTMCRLSSFETHFGKYLRRLAEFICAKLAGVALPQWNTVLEPSYP